MANNRNANTFYVDTSSAGATATSYVQERNIKLVGIVFHAAAATDVLLVSDMATNGTAAVGATKVKLVAATAGDSKQIRLADAPIVFPNGVWVTLTGTPVATLILSQQGN